jgi:hypothetical protein
MSDYKPILNHLKAVLSDKQGFIHAEAVAAMDIIAELQQRVKELEGKWQTGPIPEDGIYWCECEGEPLFNPKGLDNGWKWSGPIAKPKE